MSCPTAQGGHNQERISPRSPHGAADFRAAAPPLLNQLRRLLHAAMYESSNEQTTIMSQE